MNVCIRKLLLLMVVMMLSFLLSCNSPANLDNRIVVKFRVAVEIGKDARSFSLKTKNPKYQSGLDAINKLLQGKEVRFVTPLVSASARNEALKNYYSIVLHNHVADTERVKIIKKLVTIKVVETAYKAPIGEDPGKPGGDKSTPGGAAPAGSDPVGPGG